MEHGDTPTHRDTDTIRENEFIFVRKLCPSFQWKISFVCVHIINIKVKIANIFFVLIIFRVYRVVGGDGGSVHGRYFMLMPYYLMHFSNHKIPRISVEKYKEAEITM